MGVVLGALVPHPPVMIPEVGGEDARSVRGTRAAMKRLARTIRLQEPDTVVVLSPHAPASWEHCLYYGQEEINGDLAAFGAPHAAVSWSCDLSFLERLRSLLREEGISLTEGPADTLDHGALVPLHFLALGGVKSRVLILSAPPWPSEQLHRLGEGLAQTAGALGTRTVVLASGDLSHRLKPEAPAGYHPRGAEFDRFVMDTLSTGDFAALHCLDPALIEAAGQCALNPLLILGGALAQESVGGRRMAYEAPFGVGYGVVAFTRTHPLVALAQKAVWAYLRDGTVIEPCQQLNPSLPEQAGVFVSIKGQGQLRGCIGTMEPTRDTLVEEVIHNSIAAATRDPRFTPLTMKELPYVEVSVDVLGPRRPICGLDDLDPERYGVVVMKGDRVGLLLPSLPGIENPREQVAIACQKAGLDPDDPALSLERFEVKRYE